MKTRTPKRKCFLCGGALTASPYAGFWLHPQSETCAVTVTDSLGLSVDDAFEVVDGQVYSREVAVEAAAVGVPGDIVIGGDAAGAFFSAEAAAKRMFEAAELPYLGGSSGLRGWSSISTYQRCPHLWKEKYGGGVRARGDAPASASLEIGSLLHLFLAIHYSQRIDPQYPIDPEGAKRFLSLVPVTPEYLEEAWRLFDGHRAYYGAEEWMTPLAVEELAVDPRTGFSCRWDLVFRIDAPHDDMLPGVWVCNHKSASRNDFVGREEWRNDGQVFGEIDLYQQLGYHRKWGPLRGNLINRIIKTNVPQYQRLQVMPIKAVLREHRKSLQVWSAQMDLAAATGVYPRARAACVTRYHGLCELFDVCAGGDVDGDAA